MGHRDPANEVVTPSHTFRDGYMHPGDAPGIGVEFNEVAAARFTYDPKYLSINRRLDGSVHDW
jgi:mannonate dehydratase